MATTSNRSAKDQEALQRVFGDLPFRDALNDMRIFPDAKDILEGQPRSFTQCALALAASRMFGSQHAVIMRSVAYVDLPQPDGGRVVERFLLPKETKDLIKKFDQTGNATQGGFVFEAPKLSSTLEYRKKANARRNLRGYVPKRHYSPRPAPLTLVGVRNGTGVWQAVQTER